MKKLFFVVAFLAVSMFASAQFYIGGNVGFMKTDNDGDKTTNFQIAPDFGYVLNDSWSFGLALGFADMESGDFLGKQYTVSPYARYTFYRSGALSVFADGVFDYLNLKPEVGDSYNGWGLSIEPGIAYGLSDKFSVVAKFGSLGYVDVEDTSAYGFELNNTLQFGLYYSF